jgi:hypothetical protein
MYNNMIHALKASHWLHKNQVRSGNVASLVFPYAPYVFVLALRTVLRLQSSHLCCFSSFVFVAPCPYILYLC